MTNQATLRILLKLKQHFPDKLVNIGVDKGISASGRYEVTYSLYIAGECCEEFHSEMEFIDKVNEVLSKVDDNHARSYYLRTRQFNELAARRLW